MFEQPRADPQTNTLNQYFVGMCEDQSYCGKFALWVDIAQGFKVLIAGAPYFSPNRLLQVTSGARNPDLKFWGGRFFTCEGGPACLRKLGKFLNHPPLHPCILEITHHKLYIFRISDPPPDCCGNYEYCQ